MTNEGKYGPLHSSSKATRIINETKTDHVYESIYSRIISSQKIYSILVLSSVGGFCWIIDSVVDHTIIISKTKSLKCSSYIKLLKELDDPRKYLISIKIIDDNECFQ